MELICECGATKSNWVVIDKSKVLSRLQSDGINLSASPSAIRHIDDFHHSNKFEFNTVHFYSAGIYGQNVKQIVKEKFHMLFPGIQVKLYSDVLAAARSVSSGNTSIVSILGTGSNAVLFDGENITSSVPSLGYLFGDAGSGFHIGQLIIKAFYMKQMNPGDEELFSSQYIPDKPLFKKEIYRSDKPNTDIARFSYFLEESSDEFRNTILSKAFGSFFRNLKSVIKNSTDYKLNFVGSIASVFRNELINISKQNNYQIGTIVKDPIDGLIQYHQSLI